MWLSFDPGMAMYHKYVVFGIKSIKKLIIMSSTTATFKSFWMTHHNLRRHPFAAPGTPAKATGKSTWASLKEFFQMRQKFGRHPFATPV